MALTKLEIQAEMGRAWMIDRAWKIITERAWEWINEYYDSEELQDDDEVRRYYIHAWLGEDPRYDTQELMASDVYARRAVLAEWLREQGYDPDEILIFNNKNVSLAKREHDDAMAVSVSLRPVD